MKKHTVSSLPLLAAGVVVAMRVWAVDIERPKVQTVDTLGVDVATGQVTYSVTPVSIGGASGLSYRLSVYANEANWGGDSGFKTSYSGRGTQVLQMSPSGPAHYIYKVTDDADSADFNVLVNGVVVDQIFNLSPPYTYQAIGDSRHSLVVIGNTLEWTKPDGTVVRFGRGAQNYAGGGGVLQQIVYPSGLTIDVGAAGVTSSNGFQLRPIVEADNRPMDKADNPNLINTPPVSTSAGSGWSSLNPKYVKALNTAYEYCVAPPAACAPVRQWPTATIEWPPGMPRTLFIDDSIVRVTDAGGGITDFRYRAYDLAYDANGAPVTPPYTPGTEFSPRLVGIKTPGATQDVFVYNYSNLFTSQFSVWTAVWNARAQTSGVIKTANRVGATAGYTMLAPTMGGQNYMNGTNAGADGGIRLVHHVPRSIAYAPDVLEYVEGDEGRLTFELNGRNFPASFAATLGPTTTYQYDARGNLNRVELAGVAQMVAQYPSTCTAATTKTCNQADWIEDAKGNRTNYTYHTQSGMVSSVTAPPDQHGHRAQTRYEYTQLNAHYYNGGGSKITGAPIWMRTAERYCINSDYVSGACNSPTADEVVTRYEYNNDNLLMTGMTVTDPAGSVLRTCFQYDAYANQIGKANPNANLTSCN